MRPLAVKGWGTLRELYTKLLAETISRIEPGRQEPPLVAEVGVWKGASSAIFTTELRRLGVGKVLAVDTWLGALETSVGSRGGRHEP